MVNFFYFTVITILLAFFSSSVALAIPVKDPVKITQAADCEGADCLEPVGYSYWRNINNHKGSPYLFMVLTFNRLNSGKGPTLFRYNKITKMVKNMGPLFKSTSRFSWSTGEGWYFSASRPYSLYVNDGARMRRFNVMTKKYKTIFDARDEFGDHVYIWQMHSSDDDAVHSATLKSSTDDSSLGCIVYHQKEKRFLYFPKQGDYDECQIDKSGEWLVIKENVDGKNGEDNRIISLITGNERLLLDEQGAAGHSDMGYGYMVAADNWDAHPNAIKLWKFDEDPLRGKLVYFNDDWSVSAPNHISHSNAKRGISAEKQYVCASSANKKESLHANDVVCFRLDGSLKVKVVAPVKTNLYTAGGGDDYRKMPKGNLDITGKYFIWTSNNGTDRLDAFLVKVPLLE